MCVTNCFRGCLNCSGTIGPRVVALQLNICKAQVVGMLAQKFSSSWEERTDKRSGQYNKSLTNLNTEEEEEDNDTV